MQNLDKSGSENITSIDNSHLYYNYNASGNTCYWIHDGERCLASGYIGSESITNSYIESIGTTIVGKYVNSNYFYLKDCTYSISNISLPFESSEFKNNVVYSDGYNPKNLRVDSMFSIVSNNVFLTSLDDDIRLCCTIYTSGSTYYSNNEFYGAYRAFFDETISGNINSDGTINVQYDGKCEDYDKLFPFVKSIELLNKENESITSVGSETFTLRINFSRPMNISYDLGVYFGTIAPYSDYKINGYFKNDLQWEGEYTVKAFIENGRQYLNIVNGYAAVQDPCCHLTSTLHLVYL